LEEKDEYLSAIWLVDAAGEPRQFRSGRSRTVRRAGRRTGGGWRSPERDGKKRVYVMHVDGGRPSG
jgi:hypothetical protein